MPEKKKKAAKPKAKKPQTGGQLSDKELDRIMFGGSVSTHADHNVVERRSSHNQLFGGGRGGKMFGLGQSRIVNKKGAWLRPLYGPDRYTVTLK